MEWLREYVFSFYNREYFGLGCYKKEARKLIPLRELR